MPVTTTLIGFLLLAVAIEAVIRRRRERSGWASFAGWAVAGVSAVNFGEPSSPDYYSWLALGVALTAASVVAFAVLTPTRRPDR